MGGLFECSTRITFGHLLNSSPIFANSANDPFLMRFRESFTYVRENNLLIRVDAARRKLERTGSLVQAIVHRILEKTFDCLSLKVLKNIKAPFPFENGAEQYLFKIAKSGVNFLRQASKLKDEIETIS